MGFATRPQECEDDTVLRIACCRPGDKIVLEPGRHQVQDIKVSWPLHLVGGGSSSDDTILECPESLSGALIFKYAAPLTCRKGICFTLHFYCPGMQTVVCLYKGRSQ